VAFFTLVNYSIAMKAVSILALTLAAFIYLHTPLSVLFNCQSSINNLQSLSPLPDILPQIIFSKKPPGSHHPYRHLQFKIASKTIGYRMSHSLTTAMRSGRFYGDNGYLRNMIINGGNQADVFSSQSLSIAELEKFYLINLIVKG
jgi:hypothetical protein